MSSTPPRVTAGVPLICATLERRNNTIILINEKLYQYETNAFCSIQREVSSTHTNESSNSQTELALDCTETSCH